MDVARSLENGFSSVYAKYVPFSGCVFLSVIVCPLIPESIIGGDGSLQQGGGTPPQPEEAEREFLM